MTPAVRFENVSKSYMLCHHIAGGIKTFLFHLPQAIRQMRTSRFQALADVSFDVAAGEALGIIGPNGAGKSTALGLMAGVLRPSSGTVAVRGQVAPLLELGAGFHTDLTGRDNIMLNAVLMGMTRRDARRRIGAIVEFSELGDFIAEPVRTYSSGMVARLGFSVVAHLDPQVLLIDEILAVGDVKFQAKCMDRMRQFKRRGVTIVFVSHALESVRGICDRVGVLDRGRLSCIGEPDEAIAHYLAAEGRGA
jgi:lipopolysaccharide transport system ATP-binding protein